MPKLNDLSTFFDEKRVAWHVPGVAVAIVKDGEIIHAEGYGHLHVAQNSPIQPDTLFSIGSCTKAFTAAALGVLVDEGHLEWDKPLRAYLPDFRMVDKLAGERITIRDFLCHRSGLPPHEALRYNESPTARQAIVASLPYLEPSKDFRTAFQYSNLAYTVAGHIVEQISGLTWEAFVQQRLFNPLAMTESEFANQPQPLKPNHAAPHVFLPGTDEVHAAPFKSLHPCGPANSIVANILDMSKWLLLNLHDGQHNGTQIVPKASLATCHAPQVIVPRPTQFTEIPALTGYGFGWFVALYRGRQILFHTGGITGYTAWVSFLPEAEIGMVILTNLDQTPLPAIICYQIYDRLLGLEPVDWHARIQENAAKAKARAASSGQANNPTMPRQEASPQPLAAYTGEFHHAGYGTLSVRLEDGELTATYHSLTMVLQHRGANVFEGVYENPYRLTQASRTVTFGLNTVGKISTVSIPFEPAVADIMFNRIEPV